MSDFTQAEYFKPGEYDGDCVLIISCLLPVSIYAGKRRARIDDIAAIQSAVEELISKAENKLIDFGDSKFPEDITISCSSSAGKAVIRKVYQDGA